VLRAARANAARLTIGVDADAASMKRAARRALRSRLTNAVFVVAAVESLPSELTGVAEQVTISFPWGSLLRGLLTDDGGVLPAVSRICRPGATVTAVWSLIERDRAVAPAPAALVRRFAHVGLEVDVLRRASADEVAATESSWAKRLGAGDDRPATILRARKRAGLGRAVQPDGVSCR
jgi:16S rRNA (adenine(1408)-N(1))-methyltransferase